MEWDFQTLEKRINFVWQATDPLYSNVKVLLSICFMGFSQAVLIHDSDGHKNDYNLQTPHGWQTVKVYYPPNAQTFGYKYEPYEASKERQERRRTGGGQMPGNSSSNHPNQDWMRSLMVLSADGLESTYDDLTGFTGSHGIILTLTGSTCQ